MIVDVKTVLKILLFFFLSIRLCYSQKGKIKTAQEDFDKYAFIDSRAIYLRVVEKGYSSPEVYKQLGDSYYFTGDLKSAALWYGKMVDSQKTEIDPEYLFRYAQTLKSTKDYAASDKIMERFRKVKGDDYRASLFESKRNYLDIISEQSGFYELTDIGINTSYSEFAPSFYNEGIIYASNKPGGNTSKLRHKWNDLPFYDLYSTMTSKETSESLSLSKTINSKYHESTAIVTKDGKTLYFTRNNYTDRKLKKSSRGTNLLKLYRSKLTEKGWSNAEELPFNSDEYPIAHPALSPDEKTLYFVSNMDGGKGFSDLYKVEIKGEDFGEPENLGDIINTEGRETFPFVDDKGNLYFASDGHVGLGGLDIFMIEANPDGSFGEIFNLGEPVNSPADDFTFIVDTKKKIGYFASNREGVIGEDDIYSFRQIKEISTRCIQRVSGVIRDKNTNEVLENAQVLLLDSDNNILAEKFTSHTGAYRFDKIKCLADYSVRAHKRRYESNQKSFTTSQERDVAVEQVIYLNSKRVGVKTDLAKVLQLKPIYFDYDKSNIRPDAAIELQKIIAVLEQYPNMNIEVRSYTDARGEEMYNLNLSKRRNKATIKYIVEIGGIDQNRIIGKGYGETNLINNCANATDCEEEKHKKNRRSEFIVLKK